ncbi:MULTISPECIES: alpha-xenorhabdolysin family binary toxin subunit B [unclassified Pseudomonas]|uniref:alpha-xenorhabdolysin family binary toxin subunit B n=1 Tax=unclassified Pseudomonas TaxID=196821 RepID=UPI0035BF4FAD
MPNRGSITVDSAVPDFVKLNQLRLQLFELCDEWQEDVLPAVRDLCRELKVVMLDTDRTLREVVFGGTVLLGNKLFGFASDTAVSASTIAEASTMQAALCADLAKQTSRLELFSLSAISQQVVRLEKSASELANSEAPAKQRLENLETQHADIVEAIEAFSKPTVRKAFKGLIPSEEEIDAAFGVVKDPGVDPALLKLLSRKLASHLEVLEGARTFSGLTQSRDRLYQKIQEAKQLLDDACASKDKVLRELEATRALAGVGVIKDQWLLLVRKVEGYWQHSSSLLTPGIAADNAMIIFDDLYRYLQAVQKAFERA